MSVRHEGQRDDSRARPVRADPRAARRRSCRASLPLVGAHAATRALDGAGAAGGARAVRAGRARVRLPRLQLRHQRLLGAVRRDAIRTRSCRLHYRFAATWGAHEGSLLLWALMLAGWTRRGRRCSARHLPDDDACARARRDGARSPSASCCSCSPPRIRSTRLLPAGAGRPRPEPAAAGPGHGRSIRRCSTWATSASRWRSRSRSRRCSAARLDAAWARWSRPWTTVAWTFLTLGIALGSGWAYYELGWGGWWFWDPVENASFMPWLVGTALIHSLAVTEKRGTFQAAGRCCSRSSRSRCRCSARSSCARAC